MQFGKLVIVFSSSKFNAVKRLMLPA